MGSHLVLQSVYSLTFFILKIGVKKSNIKMSKTAEYMDLLFIFLSVGDVLLTVL
jgi:hypothetical protein